ncbi:MAG: PstS family phosphate ABC transporter substrate-binding protein [Cyanobacteria bacterium]|nr:PstS family phosphate ABC transporter substrate-binding protein [Cyanobacteriota bacterium]MDW8200579.1 PstS family phosphate ABC transporter substrate-binding protein [Cyanobacteriota bacterium SKYGB_h_bin112]
MTQKHDTAIAVAALLITAGIVGGGAMFLGRSGIKLPGISLGPSPSGSPAGSSSSPNVKAPTPASPNSSPVASSPVTSGSFASFAEVPNVPSGLFNYGGSTTWAPIRRDVDSVILATVPKFQLRYTDPPTGAPGSGSGIKMLLDNQLAFSQSSRPLNDREYQTATQRGFSLKEIPVAIDGLAVGVNYNLNVPGLTVSQLRDIYLGKITNWNQVGGPDLPIVPYSRRPEEGGTVEFFIDSVLDGQNFSPVVQLIPTTTQALRLVAKNPGGIYYATAPELVPQCTVKPLPIGRKPGEFVPPYLEPLVPPNACPNQRNQLNQQAFQQGSYPITRRLSVIVKQNGQVDQQAGEAYANLLLTNQGQDLISRAGFVRIR